MFRKKKQMNKEQYSLFRLYYLLSQCEITYGLPNESCLREGLQTVITAIPGINVSMLFVEAIRNMEDNESPFFPFSYCCKLRYLPLNTYITTKIAAPVMLGLTCLEIVMHIFIQVLAHKLDGPKEEVIMAENQVGTRQMHRRLVISETGCFVATIVRVIWFVLLISSPTQTLSHFGLFCGPSISFFVNPAILTVLSPDVRSSILQCFKHVVSLHHFLRPN